MLVACGRSLLDPDLEAFDPADAGLPTKPLDAGMETKDSGLGTKDSGVGTRDSGLPPRDSGASGDDAGEGTVDAGDGTHDAGQTTPDAGEGIPDAGHDAGSVHDAGSAHDAGSGTMDAGQPDAGGILGCFACAEEKCGKQVNACLESRACLEEGTCDLACFAGSTGGLGGLNLRCIESCAKDQQASQDLFTAVACAFKLCPQDCLGALTPF